MTMDVVKELIKNKIAETFGEEIVYSRQCEALVEDVFEKTGERLSTVTFKRLFGFTSAEVAPRTSTLDILARYCGYADWSAMAGALITSSLISDFKNIYTLAASSLEPGVKVTIRYEPGRVVELKYTGENSFIVEAATNSKLLAGDIVKIDSFNKGFELIAREVVRGGISLGPYVGARQQGISSIEITAL